MRILHRLLREGLCKFCLSGLLASSVAFAASPGQTCRQAVLEGDVAEGQGFDHVFAKGLRFFLEPLRSGWIVRVLDADAPRGPHDYAEVATPPYQSVSPLLISTDWAFRAQDAVAWNPRHFRYASNRKVAQALLQLMPKAMAGEAESSAKLSSLVAAQPDGILQVLDVRFAPGLADQAQTAAAVATHLAVTPHNVDKAARPSPLGRLEAIRFRVQLQLPPGVSPTNGVEERTIACGNQPTQPRSHHK